MRKTWEQEYSWGEQDDLNTKISRSDPATGLFSFHIYLKTKLAVFSN